MKGNEDKYHISACFVKASLLAVDDLVNRKFIFDQYPADISTSVQRCFWVGMTSRRHTPSNQRWNIVVYVNVEIYNVE